MDHNHHNMSQSSKPKKMENMDHSKMDHSQPMDHSQHKEAGKDEKELHSKHEGHSVEMFKRKFYISLFLTVPVLILSPIIQQFLGFSLRFSGDAIVLFVYSSVVFFYGGFPFLKGSFNELKYNMPAMMTLISLAIIVAYFYSSAVTFGLMGEVFFWELATLIDIMLLGHWIEMRSVMGASRALEKLSQLIPDKAHLV
mgnify:FL=1